MQAEVMPENQTNRLTFEKSPYLLQHATNPVDWFAWGSEAFDKARRENKPIFLSIGYSTCHWCHVMAHESFEDAATAAVLNRWFVPIKVDREERPDVDAIYMTAVQAMTGQGGWPLSVWLTPDLKPFYGGTYFPPSSGYGRPGFRELLERIHEVWEQQHEKVLQQGEQLQTALNEMRPSVPEAVSVDVLVHDAFRQFSTSYDEREGGFGGAPKFPRPSQFNFLLRYWQRTGESRALEMTTHTLKKMARGGMYDQIGGGFHRYSVDDRWHVPHFEKMLYDNAQLVVSYCEAWQISQEPLFAEIVHDVLRYVVRDMTHPDGAFYSAEDADSEGVEGKFYAWTMEELRDALGPAEAKFAAYYFGCEESGNWQDQTGHGPREANVLFVSRDLKQMAQTFQTTPELAFQRVEAARKRMFEVRNERVRPHLDDKILTAWNGQMIGAFARASQVFDEPAYVAAATRAADFILRQLFDSRQKVLFRRWREGEAKVDGFLDDYAFFVAGLLDLFEASQKPRWLESAIELTDIMIDRFYDEREGAFYFASAAQSDLIARLKDDYDGAEPSGNSVAIANLQRLAALLDSTRYREMAEFSLWTLIPRFRQMPAAAPQLLCAALAAMEKPTQIVIAGNPAAKDTRAMLSVVRRAFVPNKTLIIADGGEQQKELARRLKFLETANLVAGVAAAYVCENATCLPPITNPEELDRVLHARRGHGDAHGGNVG